MSFLIINTSFLVIAWFQTKYWYTNRCWSSTILGQPLVLFCFNLKIWNSSWKYHRISNFTDGFSAINDDHAFLTSFKTIYPKDIELKVKHQENHTSFLVLHIKIENTIFVCQLFDKRDKFPFFIVQMPHMSSNIPSTILYIYHLRGVYISRTSL